MPPAPWRPRAAARRGAAGGWLIVLVVFASALAGSWTYGYLRPRLPH